MKKTKKLLFSALILLLSVTMVNAQPAYDNKGLTENDAEFVLSLNVDKHEVSVGEEFAVTLNLDKMPTSGIRSISYELVYDNTKVAPVMVENKRGKQIVKTELGYVGEDVELSGVIDTILESSTDQTKSFLRNGGANSEATHELGEVLTIYFQVLDNAKGNIEIYVGEGVDLSGAKADGSTNPYSTFYIVSNINDLQVKEEQEESTKKDISNLNIKPVKDQLYTGKEIIPEIIIEDNELVLSENEDYKVTFEDNINVGKAKLIITGIGNYTGTITETFNINPINISNAIVEIEEKNTTENEANPEVTVKNNGVNLVKDKDYEVKYETSTNNTEGTVTITGKGNYTGSVTKTFKISKKDISNAKVSIVDSYYTGKNITANITIELNNQKLVLGQDYKVTYKNNKNPGTATITIEGAGNYTGTITKTFKIMVPEPTRIAAGTQTTTSTSIKWNKANVTGYEVYYSTSLLGKYTKLTTITKNTTVTYTKKGLTAGKTYYFKVRSYLTISGKKYYSDFTGSLMTTTKTVAPKIKSVGSTAASTTASWGKVSGANGYEIYRATSKNGKYTKQATLNAVSYKDENVKSGTTYYYKVRAYKIVGNMVVYSNYSNIINITTKPSNPILIATSSKDAITVKWSKVTGASGYEVYFATSANGKYKKLTSTSKTSYKKNALTPGKTYYFKVRAYKTVSGKKIYSGYTAVNSTTTPATPTAKVTAKNNNATLKWTQTSGASGYEVWYGLSKNGTYELGADITKASVVTATISNFNQSGTYYFKVRAYKVVGTTKVYGAYSAIISAKVTVPKVDSTEIIIEDYTGKDYREVKAELEAKGLIVEIGYQQTNDQSINEYAIMSQSPASGGILKPKDTITLYIPFITK